jgi:hypothetical protein
VVEAAGEVVGEELLRGAELTTGLVGWGTNRRRLPPVRCSRRKTTAGESCCPASLAVPAGRHLVQQAMAGEAATGVEQSSEEAGPNNGREEWSRWRLPR